MRRFLILLAALFAAMPAAAQIGWRSGAGYAVNLPARWFPISGREMRKVARGTARRMLAVPQTVEAGFEAGAALVRGPARRKIACVPSSVSPFPRIAMRRLLIPLAVLFAAAPVCAQQTQVFHSEAGYTVQLPAGWRQMPDAEVEAVRQAAAQAGQPFTVEAGYRVRKSATGYPFVILAWMEVGQTITPEEYAAAITSAQGQELMQEGADAVALGARLDVDAKNGTVWLRTQTPPDAAAVTPFSWTASTLHPNGSTVIAVVYYAAPGEDEARIRAGLMAIFRSLRAD